MKFTKLRFKNLYSYGDYESEVTLDRDGITFVRGVNKDNGSSNASGKSTIIEAFVWALYGKSLKDVPIDNIKCSHTTAPGWASVEFWKDDHYYEINRFRGHREYGNGVLIKKNGIIDDTFTDGTTKDVQEQIDALIGLDYYALTSSIIFSSELPFKFPKLTAEKRRAHLEEILGLQAYSEYGKIAKSRAKALKKDLDDLMIEEREKKAFLESEREDVVKYTKLLDTFSVDKERELEVLRKKLADIQSSIAAIDPSRRGVVEEMLTKYRDRLVGVQAHVQHAQRGLAQFRSEIRILEIEITNLEREYTQKIAVVQKATDKQIRIHQDRIALMQHECPTCERGWEPIEVDTHTQIHKAKIDELLDGLKEEVVDLTLEKDNKQLVLAKKRSELIKSEEEVRAELAELTGQETGLTKTIRELTDELKGLPDTSKVSILQYEETTTADAIAAKEKEENPYQEFLDDLNIKIQDHTDALEKVEDRKTDIEEKLKYATFWDESFNNDGLKLFIFESIVPVLNSRIAHYLPLLFDNKEVVCVFDKMMNMAITTEGMIAAYGGLSQGERKRIDLAIALALLDTAQAQHGVVSNLIFLDEIIDSSLDAQGVRSVLEILYSMPVQSMILMSHRSEISSEFDQILDIEKEGRFSRILTN